MVWVVLAGGPESIIVSGAGGGGGGGACTVQLEVAGEASRSPPALTARTEKLWAPTAREP